MNWPPKSQKLWLTLFAGSFILILPTVVRSETFTELKKRVDSASSDKEVIRVMSSSSVASHQSDVVEALKEIKEGTQTESDGAGYLRTYADLGAQSEHHADQYDLSQADAAAVKRNGTFADPGFERQRNWLADALRRLKDIRTDDENSNPTPRGSGVFGAIFVYLVWGILACAAAALIYFAVRHLSWQGKLKRKANSLLDDAEPDRTVDEWLTLADDHAANGRFREAVRALYLACLLRFDEFEVARFIRTETNWEHLARIQSSAKLPEGLEFRTATQRFDRIWYGYQVNGLEDVALFREEYTQLLSRLKGGSR